MRKLLRYLRMAFSAVCGIACLLLIQLWVRSYTYDDMIVHCYPTHMKVVGSKNGVIYYDPHANYRGTAAVSLSRRKLGWHYWISRARPTADQLRNLPILPRATIRIPHWSLVAVACALAALPWIRRFSLRTLLIAMAVVAVVLGVIIYEATK
jgi:hypothetical protein